MQQAPRRFSGEGGEVKPTMPYLIFVIKEKLFWIRGGGGHLLSKINFFWRVPKHKGKRNSTTTKIVKIEVNEDANIDK